MNRTRLELLLDEQKAKRRECLRQSEILQAQAMVHFETINSMEKAIELERKDNV